MVGIDWPVAEPAIVPLSATARSGPGSANGLAHRDMIATLFLAERHFVRSCCFAAGPLGPRLRKNLADTPRIAPYLRSL